MFFSIFLTRRLTKIPSRRHAAATTIHRRRAPAKNNVASQCYFYDTRKASKWHIPPFAVVVKHLRYAVRAHAVGVYLWKGRERGFAPKNVFFSSLNFSSRRNNNCVRIRSNDIEEYCKNLSRLRTLVIGRRRQM